MGSVAGGGPAVGAPAAPRPLEAATASGASQTVASGPPVAAVRPKQGPRAARPDEGAVIGAAPRRSPSAIAASETRVIVVGSMAARPDTVLATVVPTAATSEEEARKTAPSCFVGMAETDVATGAAAVATVGRRP